MQEQNKQNEMQEKLKKKRSKELVAYFKELVQKEGFFAAVGRTLKYIKRRYGKKRGRFLPKADTLAMQKKADTEDWIKISICVPVFNPEIKFFKQLLASITAQSYANWQLCLYDASDDETTVKNIVEAVNDERIFLSAGDNKGIAENTNRAIMLADGDYYAFADHDDVLSPNALFEVAQAAQKTGALFIYSDEALFETDYKNPTTGHFKPNFSMQYLLNCNYIAHFSAVEAKLFSRVGSFSSEFDGSQDHDLFIRISEQTHNIFHIPKVLYYWRQHAESTSTGIEAKPYVTDAAKKAIRAHLKRNDISAVVTNGIFPSTYKVNYEVQGSPLVSIIIPNNEHVIDLDRCIRSIYDKTNYKNFEVIVVENNSKTVETFNYYDTLNSAYKNCHVEIYEENESFNFPNLCNFGRSKAKGEYVLFLNNDTEVININWLSEMLGLCQLENTGAVGAMLYYPDDTVQHAGVIVGLGGFAGHSHKYALRGKSGYMFRQACVQELSAVTAACLMVKSDVFDRVNGFDSALSVAYNDVDLCLRIRALGADILFTPYAELYHYESKSRGTDEGGTAKERFSKEQTFMQNRYDEKLLQDPFYNPNLTMDREDFSESDIPQEV